MIERLTSESWSSSSPVHATALAAHVEVAYVHAGVVALRYDDPRAADVARDALTHVEVVVRAHAGLGSLHQRQCMVLIALDRLLHPLVLLAAWTIHFDLFFL